MEVFEVAFHYNPKYRWGRADIKDLDRTMRQFYCGNVTIFTSPFRAQFRVLYLAYDFIEAYGDMFTFTQFDVLDRGETEI